MSYTVITDLPEKSAADLLGSEYLLLTQPDYSYKISLNSIEQYITTVTSDNYQELKQKVIDDVSNYVHANAIHYTAKAVEDITKGTPVKLISNIDTTFVYVGIAGINDIAIGVCEDGILEGEVGEIMVSGILDNFNTSMWNEGDLLYAIAGQITNVQPVTNKIQFIGYVLNKAINGKVLINGSDPYPDARSILYDNSDNFLVATNVQDAIDELESHEIFTTNKITIFGNEAPLPYRAKGTIINNIAYVYDSNISNVITEYSVSLNAYKDSLIFDSADELDGKLCIVSYYK